MNTAAGNSRNWQAVSAAVYRAFPWRRAALAFALTLLAHASAYYVAPQTLAFLSRTVVPARPVELAKTEDLEKIPENLLPEEFRAKPQFVPANPNAPSATPKDESNFAAVDQRAAQEKPEPDADSRTPENAGESEESRAIAENALPRELLPPPQPAVPEFRPAEKESPPQETVGEKIDESGVEVAAAPAGTLERGETPAERASAEKKESEAVPAPAPRPQVAPPPGLNMITMRSNSAVNEIGTCSLDAKYSEFGDYTQRMLEAIQAAWYLAIRRTSIVQPAAVVVVEFTLRADGTIIDSHVVYSNASQPATYACVDAVESRAPFDPWRADMLAFIGKDTETTRLTFYYR